MLKKLLLGAGATALLATAVLAQNAAQPGAQQPGANPGQGAAPAGGRGAGNTPTDAQWNSPEAQAYVTKAKAIAGNDPDLQFDQGYNCTPTGTPQGGGPAGGGPGGDGAVSGTSGIPFVPMPSAPNSYLPPQHIFDNLWWFGDARVGSWLITTPKAYILFDTLNSADEEKAVLIDQMPKLGLDPKKIKYVIMGHYHLDHTGGGHYIQELVHPTMFMGHDDWPLYFKSMEGTGGQNDRLTDKTPMTQGLDAEDGMKLTVGDTTITLLSMTGHTPGSTGFLFNAKYQGKLHPILIITASTGGGNLRNREAFIGGFEHIWNAGEKAKVESVMQSHPNYNINTLSRMEYVNAHYPPAKNPLLYGAAKTNKYIEINRACAQARLAALGW